MKDRNKILTQLLIVCEEYDLEIININFKNINILKDEVIFTIKHRQDKFIFRYSYKKDDEYEVNSFARDLRDELDKRLMEDK